MKYFLIILFIINQSQINSQEHYAVVIEPVVDLTGQSMRKLQNLDYYHKIPVGAVNHLDGISCPRIHQLLFNEIVKVLSETLKEVLIEVPNVFYQKKGSLSKKNIFWTLKSNLISLNKLKKLKIDITQFPKPVNFKDTSSNQDQKIVTLISPFYNKITKKKYSAGTRFVFKGETTNDYIVYLFDANNLKFITTEIPKNQVLLNTSESQETKISNFIKLLKNWAESNNGCFIPYVWGGSSICDVCCDKSFQIVNKKIKNKKLNYFELPTFKHKIKTGCDCSGLILRAAQISQIPFYFKNTITITQNLDTLQSNDTINNGDLIWIPGHIIAIVDIENNFCVEASDYSKGYGRIQKIELNKMFKNINNFADLKEYFLIKQKLKRMNSQGEIISEIPFKILKLKSAWHQNNNL